MILKLSQPTSQTKQARSGNFQKICYKKSIKKSRKPLILYVGRLQYYKSVDVLIRASKKIIENIIQQEQQQGQMAQAKMQYEMQEAQARIELAHAR